MERTTAQKIIRIISILNSIQGALYFIMGAIFIFGGAFIGTADPATLTTTTTGDISLTQGELGAISAFVGIAMFVTGLVGLIVGILGLRAAKDATKIKPVWIMSIISLVLNIITFVSNLTQGNNILGSLAGVAIACLMFWACNNVKQSIGE